MLSCSRIAPQAQCQQQILWNNETASFSILISSYFCESQDAFPHLWEIVARNWKKLQACNVLSLGFILAPFLRCHVFVPAKKDEKIASPQRSGGNEWILKLWMLLSKNVEASSVRRRTAFLAYSHPCEETAAIFAGIRKCQTKE